MTLPPFPWFQSYDSTLPHTLRPYPEQTLLDVVQETVLQRPGHLALAFKGLHMTYAELEQHVNAFAAALLALGVQKGERLATLLPNSPQAVITQLAAWKVGAILTPINALYTERELNYALIECGAETIVTLAPFYDKVKVLQGRTSLKRIIVANIKEYLPAPLRLLFTLLKEKKEGYRVKLQAGDYAFSDLMRQYAGAGAPPVSVAPSDPAILLFSGGTTGGPKAALGTHHALFISAMQLRAYARAILVDWDDRVTVVMPMFHVYGNMAVNTALVSRWPMVLVPNPRDIDDLLATIRKERPAVLHGVPTLFNALINHPTVQAGRADLQSLKVCYSAAAPLMRETRLRFEALTGGRLLEAYAMTETILAAVVCPVQRPYKDGSTGVPLPDVELRIVDLDTEADLPLGQPGEILIRAPQTMLGYWQRPEETVEMIRDGWVYTGDIGYMDEEGYLFIIDRKKDLIKPSGFQVWPREVEEVIATHPAVSDVSVAGVPDAVTAEAVKAWIVLRPGCTATADEIRAHCRQGLTSYKIPKYIEFRDSLPKTLVGKTLRRSLVSEA